MFQMSACVCVCVCNCVVSHTQFSFQFALVLKQGKDAQNVRKIKIKTNKAFVMQVFCLFQEAINMQYIQAVP